LLDDAIAVPIPAEKPVALVAHVLRVACVRDHLVIIACRSSTIEIWVVAPVSLVAGAVDEVVTVADGECDVPVAVQEAVHVAVGSR